MKTILLAIAGALIATTAVAQSPSGGPGRESRDYDRSYERRDDRRDYYDRDSGPSGREHEEMMRRHMGSMGGGRGMSGGMPGMFGRPSGAHFRLQRGDARIDIRCGDNESIGTCVDAASRLMDKVMSLRPGAEAAGPRPGGTTPTPGPETPRPQ